MDGFPEWQDSQGVTLNWGGIQIVVTSLTYSRSLAGEVDVTGIDSNQHSDPNNTGNRRVVKGVEYGVIDPGELQCEFVGPSTFGEAHVGRRAPLAVQGLANSVVGDAYLTNVQISARAGEPVTGSCTFKLSGNVN